MNPFKFWDYFDKKEETTPEKTTFTFTMTEKKRKLLVENFEFDPAGMEERMKDAIAQSAAYYVADALKERVVAAVVARMNLQPLIDKVAEEADKRITSDEKIPGYSRDSDPTSSLDNLVSQVIYTRKETIIRALDFKELNPLVQASINARLADRIFSFR